ncbi:helix-turn-helix transcriptional regulator [Longispora sp. NPDC051575]|uniref:helix-turn-helix transcriptional regulator n=1 Tax=Longispora sp. NPDC051575 TaxID=3154943 RepID=UPI003418F4C2
MRRPRTPLAARRRARGLSQETLAERLGVDRSTVARWEDARTVPQPGFRPGLAAALGWSADELHAALTEPGPAVPTASGTEDPVPPEGEAGLLDLHDRLYALARRYDTVPSARLLAPVAACHREASALARTLRDPALLPRARTALAEAAILLGRVVWDASARTEHTTALAHFDRAAAIARAAGDPVAETHALLRTSYVALYGRHDPAAGAVLARRAVASARHSPSLRALGLLHVAEAHATLGAARDCEATLDAAHGLLADFDVDDVGRFLLGPVPGPRLAAVCHLRLGHPARARALLEGAADLPTTKTTTLLLGTLARAHAREGHLDAAVATLHRALSQLDGHRGAAGLQAVLGAVRDLDRWPTDPAVATLRDHLATLRAA